MNDRIYIPVTRLCLGDVIYVTTDPDSVWEGREFAFTVDSLALTQDDVVINDEQLTIHRRHRVWITREA